MLPLTRKTGSALGMFAHQPRAGRGLDAAFEKGIELLFDKLWLARPGLKLDLGQEGLEVFLYQQ
ncbi:MAG: hypothetical protein ACREX9_22080 [Gammaproteobacteria bacterium]